MIRAGDDGESAAMRWASGADDLRLAPTRIFGVAGDVLWPDDTRGLSALERTVAVAWRRSRSCGSRKRLLTVASRHPRWLVLTSQVTNNGLTIVKTTDRAGHPLAS